MVKSLAPDRIQAQISLSESVYQQTYFTAKAVYTSKSGYVETQSYYIKWSGNSSRSKAWIAMSN